MGISYTGIALLVGAQLTVAGRDLTIVAGGVIELSFAALGYVLGLVIEARRGEREAAHALRQQLEVLADTQRRLAQAEKLASLGQLAGAIAHEVRNPLAILRSLVQNLDEALASADHPAPPSALHSGAMPSDPRAQCDMLLEEIDRLAHVTSSLVDFARPPKLMLVTVPAAELIERVALLAGQMMRTSAVRLVIERVDPEALDARAAGDEPLLHVDADLICQALLELIENATVLAPSGSRVALTWHGDGAGGVVFRVRDAGPGVPPEHRTQVFDPFFTARPGGTGLGLAVVKHVVEAHGGTIFVAEADDASAGACFEIHLPASGAARSVA